METVAHSRQPNKVAATLSGKINGGGFSGKSLYDDVYGGPPQKLNASAGLSPRFEDYGEIFGSFHAPRASSIPVLDLPAVDEADAFFDPRSSAFSYTEVFGALDFAASFEDLLRQPSRFDGVSSDEAWTPVDTDSFSGESDHSANNQNMSIGDYFQSVEGGTEFSMSYHKVTGSSNEHMSKGKTHMTQMHAVPGFTTLVYDETERLHERNRSFQVADDIDLEMEFGADKVKINNVRKTKSHLRNFTSGEQTFASDLNLHNGFGRNASHSGEMFITVSDISLRSMPSQVPPPSRPPPVLDAKKRDARGFHSNSGQVASEETPGDGSPPFFDVEVDMNSSAAASAAAMKEAMHKAEAKLRSAKESKERKKGVHEIREKSSYDVQSNESKTRLNCLDDATMQKTSERRQSRMKVSVIDERQKAGKASPETPDSLEGKKTVNMFEEKHTKESRSSQESDRSTGDGTWKEETEFFELVGTDESRKVIQPTKSIKVSVQATRAHEGGRKEIEASKMQEHKKTKATEEDYQMEEHEKKANTAKEGYDPVNNTMKSKTSNEECKQREQVKKERVAEIFEQAENEKSTRMAQQLGKTEKKANEVDQSGILKDASVMRHKEHKQVKIEKSKKVDRPTSSEVQLGVRLKENEKKLREAEMQQQSVKMHGQYEKLKENEKKQIEDFALGQAGDEEILKDFVELEDIDDRSNGAFKQDIRDEIEACGRESEMRLKLAKQIQNKKGLNEGSKKDETEEGPKDSLWWDENEKQLEEEFELEVNETRLKETFKQRGNQAYERDQNKKEHKEASVGCEEENRLQEAGDNEGIQKDLHQAHGQERNGGMFTEALRNKVTESQSNQTLDGEGSENVSNEDEDSHQEPSENMDKDFSGTGNGKGPDKDLNQMDDNEVKGNTKIDEATDEISEKESSGNLPAAQSVPILENIGKLGVSQESVADQETGMTRSKCNVGENKLKEIGVENQLDNEKTRAPEITAENAEHFGIKPGKVDDSVKKADYGRRTETDKPATVQEAVNVQKTAQSTERKEKSLNETPATLVKDAERMRRERELEKDRLRKIEEERDREREREREKDRMAVDKAMLEAEREREREKDRMAVDRATFEARDRAFAEACERAERAAFERATAEARQRALAEARERLEKACAEARDRSYADKVSTEARLKAERAAVERATAEVQERAKEKLKAERAAFESRDRLERSVSDQFGVCSRYGGRQDSLSSDMRDPQLQNLSTSTGSRHPYSLYGASSFSERSEREGESAQRCRARLERHRRTAERAAKALAEKNMRDLLAQKEQAERNRLAETLDAEVKRWSSGKEGNLRALLSTLQYILGPDCGWQPIPLTEVITSAAVKKAYRKATLCVHPDKLQQRGASIQHKYICEKVFDLLKEAWNKFNSEER